MKPPPDAIETDFTDEGKESINGYVNKAILVRMGLEEWPEKESEQST